MEELSNKLTGSALTPSEWNQLAKEMENIITSQQLILSGIDLLQMTKSISAYSTQGDFYNSNINISENQITLVIAGTKVSVDALENGMRVRFNIIQANSAAVTLTISGLATKNLEKFPGTALASGDLEQDNQYEAIYFSSQDKFFIISPQNDTLLPIGGTKETWHEMNSNSTFPDDRVDFGPGATLNHNDNVVMTSSGFVTKLIGANWVAGTNNGGFASSQTLVSNQTIFCFIVGKSTDPTDLDFGFDTVPTGVNLIADTAGSGFNLKRCIGILLTDDDTDILEFFQKGDTFVLVNGLVIAEVDTVFQATNFDSNIPFRIPKMSGIQLDSIEAYMSITANEPNEEKCFGTFLDPASAAPAFNTEINTQQPFRDFYGKDYPHGGYEAGDARKITLSPNDSAIVLSYADTYPTIPSTVQIEFSASGWTIDRRKLL